MSSGGPARPPFPESVRETLDDFVEGLDLDVSLWLTDGATSRRLYPDPDHDGTGGSAGIPTVRRLQARDGSPLELRVAARDGAVDDAVANLVAAVLSRSLDSAHEIRFFTYELTERYEEINLLYSISETLGSILRLDEAARVILGEVCDVMGAVRGSLWVHDPADDFLHLVASVGGDGVTGPIDAATSQAVSARVFREARPMMALPEAEPLGEVPAGAIDPSETFLSVPVRYTPPEGEARTVGVMNLIGRRHAGRFTASDQKLLSAIATQVGAALENNRLIRQSLMRERMAREMELAHNLQMKLLPGVDRFEGMRIGARVEPAEMVGGDFYQLFHLSGGKVGVMVGDVSSHGFPAALIMALSMSAATIYAHNYTSPARVLRFLDDSLRDELESTEMYLSLFYGVLDPREGVLTWCNAGHPHAFLIGADGHTERLGATDPPVGIAGPDAYSECTRPWDPAGDVVLLFTDGLSDAAIGREGEKGEELVLRTAVEHRDADPETIVDILFEQVGALRSSIPADDRTAVVLAGAR